MPTIFRATLLPTLAVLMAALATARLAFAGEPLPRDPTLIEGRLDNGLRYAIRARTDVQEAAVYLIVDVSPMDEAPDEIEASRLVGLLPLGATMRFPDDARAALQESLGAGARIDSRVSFNGTWFVMDIPEPEPARLAAAITFAADVLSAPSFADENIDTQRDALFSLRAAATTPRTRAQAELFSGLRMEVDLGRRFLGAEKGEILALDADTLRNFHTEWYAPANAVLVVVGDVNAAQVQAQIRDAFADITARPAPTREPFGPPAPDLAPLLIAQSGLSVADADFVRTEPPRPAIDTVEALRDRVVEGVVEDIVELRLAEAARRRHVDAETTRAWTFDMGGRFTLRNVYLRGAPEDWPALAGALADAIESLRAAPISAEELALVRDTRIAAERRKIAAGDGADASDDARRIAEAMLLGSVPMALDSAAAARIAALDALDLETVSRRAARLLPAQAGVMALTTPPLDATPDAPELAAAFAPRAELNDLRASIVDADAVFAALGDSADGAAATQIELHPAGAVLSAWLDNGVRVHHRQMSSEPGLVRVSVAITGGRIDETPATHGLTDAATVLFRSPATASIDARTLAGALDRTTVQMTARANEDLVLVQASAVREDLPTLLRVLTAALREGRIDPVAFDRWHSERLDRARQERITPYMAGAWTFAATAYDESAVSVQPPTPEEIETITPEATQQWLDRLLADAALEVAIVGDIGRKEAVDLAAHWFGSLPTQRRVTEARLLGNRTVEYAPWPHRRTFNLGADTDQGLVFVGFHTPGRMKPEEIAKLQVAAAALSSRVKRESRDAPEMVDPPYAVAWSSDAYDNHGFVVGVGVTTAQGADAVGDRLDKGLEWLLLTGPDSIMLAELTEQVAGERERALASAETWAERLARLDYHRHTIDDMLAEPARIRALTVDEVFVAVRRNARAASIFKIVIKGGESGQ